MNCVRRLPRRYVVSVALALALPIVVPASGVSAGSSDRVEANPSALAGRTTLLKGLPDAAVLTVGSRSSTVGNVRAQMRLVAFRSMAPMHTLDQKGSMHGVFGDLHSGMSPSANSLDRSGPELAQSSNKSATRLAGPPQLSIADPSYCPTHPPFVSGIVRGKITSGGYVVIQGGCFGTAAGTVRMTGRFDSGAVTLPVQSWSNDSITAAIPDMRGVYDQKVGFEVVRGTFVSSNEPAMFVAARETLPLPAHFITPATCSMIWSAGFCMDGRAFHDELAATAAATDVWQAQAPAGWVLSTLQTSPGIGSVAYAGGFEQGPPDAATWSMAWTAGVSRTITESTDWGIFVNHSSTSYYGESYAMSITATGPVGTMPQ